MWVIVVCILAAASGLGAFVVTLVTITGSATQAFAAGALLTMITDDLIPELTSQRVPLSLPLPTLEVETVTADFVSLIQLNLNVSRNIFLTFIGQVRQSPKPQPHKLIIEGIEFTHGGNMHQLMPK
jgi:hypothetical protein